MTDKQPPEPTDAELDELRQANSGKLNFVTFSEFRTIARAVLAKWGVQPVAPSEPTPAFDDPRVQAVYGILCDDADWPPKDEPQQHWEGWIARRIVERLFQEPVVREPLTDEQVEALITTEHFREGYKLKASDRICLAWYRLGLRDGERAHGITGGQHNAASS